MMSEIASVQSVVKKRKRERRQKNDLNFSVENFFDRKNIFFLHFSAPVFDSLTLNFSLTKFFHLSLFSMHFFGGVFLCSFLSLHMRF